MAAVHISVVTRWDRINARVEEALCWIQTGSAVTVCHLHVTINFCTYQINISSMTRYYSCTGYAFCMVFHVRWIFLTTSLRRRVVRRVVRNPSHMENIQDAFSRIFYTLRYFNQAKYNVQSYKS